MYEKSDFKLQNNPSYIGANCAWYSVQCLQSHMSENYFSYLEAMKKSI